MAATLVIARFDMLTKAEYEAARVAAEELQAREPNNPRGYVNHYDSRAAYDLEAELGRLGYYAGAEQEAERVRLVLKYVGKLPGLTIEVREPALVGQTIRIYSQVERVMSDVWDNVTYIENWVEGAVVTTGEAGCTKWNYDGGSVYLEGLDQNGLQSDYSEPGPGKGVRVKVLWKEDADGATKEAAEAYRAERNRVAQEQSRGSQFVDEIEKRIQAARGIKQTNYCRVVKGRKAPKGAGYYVKWVGDGQYGPYAHLISADGKEYKFISLDNLESTPDWDYEFKGSVYAPGASESDGILEGLVRRLAADGEETQWFIIADRVEELLGTAEAAGAIRERIIRRQELRAKN